MKLTSENYFSKEAMQEYLSVSQYKDFVGSLGMPGCEAQAMAKLRGEWETEMSTALLVGSYVDAHFEGRLNLFKAQNPSLFKKDGGLKADYIKADEIINRIERDSFFMDYMSGDKQTIMTAEMFGAKWKIKTDSYLKGKAIVDLKTMKSITEKFWIKDLGYKIDFIQNWGYDLQAAIYQEVDYLNTGKRLPFFIAAASKEKVTDIEVIFVPTDHIGEKLIEVERNVPRILALKSGEEEPTRCGICDYCKHTKALTRAIHMSELMDVI